MTRSLPGRSLSFRAIENDETRGVPLLRTVPTNRRERKARREIDGRLKMLSYLKISKLCVGLVLNFNVKVLTRDGIMRKVNGFPE